MIYFVITAKYIKYWIKNINTRLWKTKEYLFLSDKYVIKN